MNTIVITGTNKGIGLATAQLFLDHGWRVIGTYRQSPPSIVSANFVPIRLDLSDPQSIATAADAIRIATERIDALVNNSGVLNDGLDTVPGIAKIRQTFDITVFGAIDLTERLISVILEGGSIVNISSIFGSFAFPVDDGTALGYRMSKAAINMYTRSLAARLKERKIVVSSLHPGWVNTEMGRVFATETDGPNVKPSGAAQDIYNLVTTNTESGFFWNFGKKREW